MQLKDMGAQIARADGLDPGDSSVLEELFDVWRRQLPKNQRRDRYYLARVPVKDLGISVSPELMAKISPRCDWAAKCVDWWADRVQFDGFTCEDGNRLAALEDIAWRNDLRNVTRKVTLCALRHGVAFLTVTAGDPALAEPPVVVSGYPATVASAVWDDTLKRVRAGMVVAESERVRGTQQRLPTLVHAFLRDCVISIRRARGSSTWTAEYQEHSMGRPTFEPVAYHATLERPFGRSRITSPVMWYVDEAQREMANSCVASAFSAIPQKFMMGVDREVGSAVAESRYEAYMGSVITATMNKKGGIPNFGQLPQISMQPHTDYFRSLAAGFSGVTGVPLSSLGVVSDNPSSAEAIYASKEDAVVDIQAYVDGLKVALRNVALMALAATDGTDMAAAMAGPRVDVNYRNPAMPSVVSQSDAVTKQLAVLPWMGESDVPLREFGYSDEQIRQLSAARAKSKTNEALMSLAGLAGDE